MKSNELFTSGSCGDIDALHKECLEGTEPQYKLVESAFGLLFADYREDDMKIRTVLCNCCVHAESGCRLRQRSILYAKPVTQCCTFKGKV